MKDVYLTTTDEMQGMIVKKYLGPITGFLISNTNIFSDIVASFGDLFGGFSGTYQKQVQNLYNAVMDIMKEKASKLGANCILNLKFDFEEISGQGKQMFLLLATGTGAIVELPKVAAESHSTISSHQVTNEIEKNRLKRQIANSPIYSLEIWKKLSELDSSEIFLYLLKKIATDGEEFFTSGYQNQIYDTIHEMIKSQKDDIRILNSLLSIFIDAKDKRFQPYIYPIYKEQQILNYEKLFTAIKDRPTQELEKLIQLLTIDKEIYEQRDIELLENIINILKNIPESVTWKKKKKLLSSTEEEVWECKCGKENNKTEMYCTSCERDRFGFTKLEKNPQEITNMLQEKVEALKIIFSKSTT